MKKVLALAATGASYLTLAPSAFGASVNLCPAGSEFSSLCDIVNKPLGQIITQFIVIVLIIAVIASLFFLIYGGIRWITSGGDEKQVETAKSHVVAAIVGLIIALAAFFILQFILRFFGIDVLNFQFPTILG